MVIVTPTKSGTEWEDRPEAENDGDDSPHMLDNSIAASVSPDISADDSTSPDEMFLIAIKRLLQWIRNGSNARTKEIRLQAAFYFVDQKNQVELAREIGVKKATISQQAVELRDYFRIKRPAGAASQMRSPEARETFSKVCAANHKKRKAKASLQSEELPTKSGSDTWKPLSLQEIASYRAARRLPPLTNAASS